MHLCLIFFVAGLKEPYFVAFNGGFSQAQLDWFNEVLKFSDENQEKVIVTGRWIWRGMNRQSEWFVLEGPLKLI